MKNFIKKKNVINFSITCKINNRETFLVSQIIFLKLKYGQFIAFKLVLKKSFKIKIDICILHKYR